MSNSSSLRNASEFTHWRENQMRQIRIEILRLETNRAEAISELRDLHDELKELQNMTYQEYIGVTTPVGGRNQ